MAARRKYSPQFAGPIEGYCVNHLKQNFWRLQSSMEYQDAMQEAQLVFYRLVAKYPKVKEPQHFMALFKTAWGRRVTDLAHVDTHCRCEVAVPDDGDSSDLPGDLDNNGMVTLMIQQAPAEVKRVLALFLVAPAELLELAVTSWRQNGHNSPEGNKWLCRSLGFAPGTDVIGMVEKYFRG